MNPEEIEKLHLTKAETRAIVTPYAFKVDQALLGLPLATPLWRALAIIIDVALVFVAAKISATIIAFVAAMAFYKGTAQEYLPKMSPMWRKVLKIMAASILFVCSVTTLSLAIDFFEGGNEVQGIKIQSGIKLTSKEKEYVKDYFTQVDKKSCDEPCQQTALANLTKQIPKLDKLEELESVQLTKVLLNALVKAKNKEIAVADLIAEQPAPTTSKSILQWGEGIIQDLGLGFGWAAVYFTLFSLLWRGQTPGKKICNIRVVALNGEPLGLLDCFGRYGGYGAGFATGLLGFLQVYWDPNRQAIQDKISATVVIKGNLNQQITEDTVEKTVHK